MPTSPVFFLVGAQKLRKGEQKEMLICTIAASSSRHGTSIDEGLI
jgi:hypothetical protein